MTVTSCPSCGAEVTFRYGSSIVVICAHCSAAVARTDRGVEDLGRVAALLDTGSPLRAGLDGRFSGVSFRITGRVQLQHAMGGVWDEWYAAFGDGRWGWLAEAQGQFYLTFQQKTPADVPSIADLRVGERLSGSFAAFVVDEVGEAAARSGEGEIPWRVVPGDRYDYADLSASDDRFATLDFSEAAPLLFAGKRVTLEDLGISAAEAQRVTHVRGNAVNCSNCGAPLELRMPEKAERIACSHCGSLLDVTGGKLSVFQALREPEVTPQIPLGSSARIGGVELTVAGFMRRSTRIDGETYMWDEYLLYNPRAGFRWLVQSDRHWSLVRPLAGGDVDREGGGPTLSYKGKRFQIFQQSFAKVEHVLGEFYWKVEVGETVEAIDFIAPPEMISCESSENEGAAEVVWSLGTYMPVADVEKAFRVTLPKPETVAPNQPNPFGLSILVDFAIFAAVVVLLAVFFFARAERRTLVNQTFELEALATGEQSKVFFTEPFDIHGRRNLVVSASAPVDNSWVNIDADLVNEASSVTQQFSVPVEYYHGVEDGESWTEGNNRQRRYLKAVPGGRYTMRIEVQWEGTYPPAKAVEVELREGVPHAAHLLVVLFLLALGPLVALVRRVSFETRRWEDSMFTATGVPKSSIESSEEE